MKHLLKIVSIFLVIIWSTMCDNNDNGNGDVMPQENIPWPSLADSPWPMYHHDPQGTGRSQYVGPQLGEIAFTFGDGFWFEGSVVIGQNNVLYLVTSGNDSSFLYAIEPSGQILWKTFLLTAHFIINTATPVISSEGIIYVSSGSNNFSNVHAIRTDGAEFWTYPVDERINSGVTLDAQGNLYFITSESGRLVSLTPDGELRWELAVTDGFQAGDFPGVFSPNGSTLYIGGNDSLYAVTTEGDIIWGYWTSSEVLYSLVDNEGNIYFYNEGDSSITSLDPAKEINWRTHIDTLGVRVILIYVAPTMDVDGNLYFAGGTPNGSELISLNGANGSINWESSINNSISTSLICDVNSRIYFAGWGDRAIRCVSSDGTLLWQVEASNVQGVIANSPAIGSDGLCYFPVVNDHLVPVVGIQ